MAAESKLPRPIEMLSPRKLRPAKRNARTHPKEQIRDIAASIDRFGFINPIIADSRGQIVSGHGRAEAAKLAGLNQVPVIRVSHLNETELRAYRLADNKLAEKARWDRETLAIEFEELQIDLPQIGLDIGITGFEPGEIDSILLDFSEDQVNPADQIPQVEVEAAIAQKGELFVLGPHRLAVGDARDQRAYEQLMQAETAGMAFLDPPYNVKIDGHVGDQPPARQRANSGLFAKSREISVRPGLRGGGRSRIRTRLHQQIPC
jgi:hypothetical protein